MQEEGRDAKPENAAGEATRMAGTASARGHRVCQKVRELERVKGIEPSYSAWKAAALPLSYTRARS